MSQTIKIDTSSLGDFNAALGATLKPSAAKFAMRATLNDMAFGARKDAIDTTLPKSMILRNKWTQRGVRVKKASTQTLQSHVGHVDEYMARQESGGTATPRAGARSYRVPTADASRESTLPRKRDVTRGRRMKNIRTPTRSRMRKWGGRTPKQVRMIRVKMSIKEGFKFVRMRSKRGRMGMYRIAGRGKKAKLRLVHDMSRRTMRVKENPWLRPAAEMQRKKVKKYYSSALDFQFKRMSKFRG